MEEEIIEITEYTGGEYKPWWVGDIDNNIKNFHGFNSGTIGGTVDEKLEKMVSSGQIKRDTHYLVTIKFEIKEFKER